MTLNWNIRGKYEYRVITDGKRLFRLSPQHKIPAGTIEIFRHHGEKIYTSMGTLKPMFRSLQEVEPRNNEKLLVRAVRNAIDSGAFHYHLTITNQV